VLPPVVMHATSPHDSGTLGFSVFFHYCVSFPSLPVMLWPLLFILEYCVCGLACVITWIELHDRVDDDVSLQSIKTHIRSALICACFSEPLLKPPLTPKEESNDEQRH